LVDQLAEDTKKLFILEPVSVLFKISTAFFSSFLVSSQLSLPPLKVILY
jgi:hypothetical protein